MSQWEAIFFAVVVATFEIELLERERDIKETTSVEPYCTPSSKHGLNQELEHWSFDNQGDQQSAPTL
ncbi:hypothetical protein DPMN_055920 [Dreissena polymorpha]|uniref:Uncharacterized protein n=1 Tax=Dreissena polymorpha TaxID=45954 RepID=A0A9D4HR21_DREPO|nr:hypothetical protein DPMN_055920 [Dreissena polymorpha]